MKAIPTMYKGILFRSRLEAKWASFFDKVNWKWQYEPCDFDGWIPDFALYGDNGTAAYVEVKPTVVMLDDIANEIDNSGCVDEVILLGETCPLPKCNFDDGVISLGWIRECCGITCSNLEVHDCSLNCNSLDYEWWWQNCHMTEINKRFGFCAELGDWKDRITGIYDKSSWWGIDVDLIRGFWAEACNSSQWRKPS